MPEPVEGKMRFENGKWQAFFDGAWITLTDEEQQRYLKDLLQESGLGGISELNTIPPAFTPGTPTGPPAGPGTPSGRRPRPPGEVYPSDQPWPIKKRVPNYTELGQARGTKEVDDIEAMYTWEQRALKAGYVLNEGRTAWVKKEEEPEEPPKSREDLERFLLQNGLWDRYEVVPNATGDGWAIREKKVALPGKEAPAPFPTEPNVFTDPDTGVRYVETSPGRWDEQTRPPVTRESVATSVEQLLARAIDAGDWDQAWKIIQFQNAPTDLQRAQMALQFAESTANFDTWKAAYEFFGGQGAAGLQPGGAPPIYGPSGEPVTQAQLSMGQTPVPLLPPGAPGGGPQFPGFPTSTTQTGAVFGQPRNVEADLQKELDALGQKAQASQEGTGPDLTLEEADRLRSLPQLLAASKAGPPQFPESVMEQARAAAQAGQDRGVIDAFAPYNFPDVDIGGRKFSMTDPVARYWLTLNETQQKALLDSGWEPTPGQLPEGLVAPPTTSFARNQFNYWGQPGGRTSQIISEFPSPGIQVNKPGATVQFLSPEEQLALAKANQQFAAQGVYGQGGYDVSGAPSAWEEFQRFKGSGVFQSNEARLRQMEEARANQPEGSIAGQVSEEEKGILAKQIPDFAMFQKAKPAGYKFKPEPVFQPRGIERLRRFPRPAKKQFSPRTRVFA